MIRDILLATANAIHMCKEGDSRSHWSRRFIYHSSLIAAACDCCQRWRTFFFGLLLGVTLVYWLMRITYSFGLVDLILALCWGIFISTGVLNYNDLALFVKDRKTYLVDSRLMNSPKDN